MIQKCQEHMLPRARDVRGKPHQDKMEALEKDVKREEEREREREMQRKERRLDKEMTPDRRAIRKEY